MGRPEGLALVKYEGLGNDFLVLLDAEGAPPLDVALARAACDRHRGWGADGMLRGSLAPPGAAWHLAFQLLNADGSEAEVSGNGLRCLVHAAVDEGLVNAGPGSSVSVVTPAGGREVHIRALAAGEMWASTEMGEPKVRGGAELCNVGDGQLLVDVGNPHLVVLGPDPASIDVSGLGRTLSAAVGEGGCNVEFVTLGPGPDEVTMRVWERGVGETLACGTGSVAAAAALRHWGRVASKVTVHQPGGSAEVELRSDGAAVLSGPSHRIGRCFFDRTGGFPGFDARATVGARDARAGRTMGERAGS
ncbi:MAG TPA: diaminopimelate epimerase [Acidimicrobiales bacterium]|nr:diaminopimelate epimerase [Acidimicrobiales bacterium]